MVRVTDHEIESLAVGVKAESRGINGVACDKWEIAGVIGKSGRALIAQQHLLVTQKKQIKIVIVIVIEPDRLLETAGGQGGLDGFETSLDVVHQQRCLVREDAQ